MHFATKLGALLATGAFLVGLPSPAAAQRHEHKVNVDGWGGVALPSGALDRVADVGAAFGGGLAWRFHPHFAVRGDVEVALLTEVSTGGVQVYAPMDLVHFNGGVEINFPEPSYQHTPLTFSLNLGAGATRMQADATAFVPTFEATYFTLNSGMKIGYQVHEKVNVFARGALYLIVTDEDETAVFTGTPIPLDAFSEAWSVPITLGVRLTVP